MRPCREFIGDVVGSPAGRSCAGVLPRIIPRWIGPVVWMPNAAGVGADDQAVTRNSSMAGVDVHTHRRMRSSRSSNAMTASADRPISQDSPAGRRGRGQHARLGVFLGRTYTPSTSARPIASWRNWARRQRSSSSTSTPRRRATSNSSAATTGRVSAVLGTHRRRPRAGLAARTAYQTDVGMTGPYASLGGTIGSSVDPHLCPCRFRRGHGDPPLGACRGHLLDPVRCWDRRICIDGDASD